MLRSPRLLAFLIVGVFSSASLFAGALSLRTSEEVLMIDGKGDRDVTVTVGVIDIGSGYDFGYVESGAFTTIVDDSTFYSSATFTGGEVVDFAIRSTRTGEIVGTLSDGSARMYFFGDIAAGESEKPQVEFDYWQSMTVTWSVGGTDIVFDIGGPNDGFAPASFMKLAAVPEPSSLALMGFGVAALGLFARRKRHWAR